MRLLIDSFWRAVGYCLHPRVIALSLLPLLLIVLLTGLFWYLWWDGAVASLGALLAGSEWLSFSLWGWLQGFGVEGPALLAPVLLVVLITPAIVVLSVLAVAMLMAPALVSLVARRRFPSLERRGRGSFLASLAWSLGSTVAALVALVLSIPLWFIPPLVLVLPPLIWGWLTYRVMAFDALGEHADKAERETIMRQYKNAVAGHRRGHGLPGGCSRHRLGLGHRVRGSIPGPDPRGGLDLYAGIRLFLPCGSRTIAWQCWRSCGPPAPVGGAWTQWPSGLACLQVRFPGLLRPPLLDISHDHGSIIRSRHRR